MGRLPNASWDLLPEGARQALEQQWLGVGVGGLPCGAAVLDFDGRQVSIGRNRAYESATRQDPLENTRVAHAELNALARVPADLDHSELVVWSTQRPCAMCAAAIAFIGIGKVRYVADNPSDHHPAAEICRDARRRVLCRTGRPPLVDGREPIVRLSGG